MPPPSEASTATSNNNLEIILHHLLPLLLLSSLSVKTFVGRWHLLRSKLTHLQASLSQLSSSFTQQQQNPLLHDHLLPNLLSTLHTIHSLSEQCRDPGSNPCGKLLMQSNLDSASSSLSLNLRHLDLLLSSGVLSSTTATNPTAIVLPQPGPSASRDELAFFVRDLFARLQIGGPEFKKKALDSLLHLLREDDGGGKNSVLVADEGDVACLIHLLDSHGHPLAIREQAVLAISILAAASDSSRKAVFEEGALGPLLRLLETGSAAVKEKAAAAVEAITADPENAWAVSAYGGIRALIEACRSGSPAAVQAHASGALSNVAAVEDIRRAMVEEDAIPVVVDLLNSGGRGSGSSSSSSSGNAAHFLWMMASSGEEFRQAIVQEGGLQKLLQLLHEPPNPETIDHVLRAIYALSASASTARALSSTTGFLTQLAELIRQGSVGLQHISASLICNLSPTLTDERKRALAGCMGALVKVMELPSKPAVGMQEVAARALVSLLSVRSNRKEFVREEKNVLKLVQMLDPRNEGVCKSHPISVAAALTSGGGCRKRLVAAGACSHLQVLADMDVAGARKVMQRLAGSRLKNIFFTRAWRE